LSSYRLLDKSNCNLFKLNVVIFFKICGGRNPFPGIIKWILKVRPKSVKKVKKIFEASEFLTSLKRRLDKVLNAAADQKRTLRRSERGGSWKLKTNIKSQNLAALEDAKPDKVYARFFRGVLRGFMALGKGNSGVSIFPALDSHWFLNWGLGIRSHQEWAEDSQNCLRARTRRKL